MVSSVDRARLPKFPWAQITMIPQHHHFAAVGFGTSNVEGSNQCKTKRDVLFSDNNQYRPMSCKIVLACMKGCWALL